MKHAVRLMEGVSDFSSVGDNSLVPPARLPIDYFTRMGSDPVATLARILKKPRESLARGLCIVERVYHGVVEIWTDRWRANEP